MGINLKSVMILIIFCLFIGKLAFKYNVNNNIIMICMFITLIIDSTNETFGSTAASTAASEAVANVASMYNPNTKTLKLSNLELS